ncbi:hypothetical protein [Vibrio quintilis]|uniref:Lipoprotein n=1 Tax=Vibrio quintilis TaxID=1117707 RepID=A0A1M7YZH9_9VIBR|nr:hypothetical protein [Vibrio quintilis]SHO57846.1 hypothetical protein VQ7734_03616 [Vibrio quintilis]
MKSMLILLVSAVLAGCATTPQEQVDITGRWHCTLELQLPTQKEDMTADGEPLPKWLNYSFNVIAGYNPDQSFSVSTDIRIIGKNNKEYMAMQVVNQGTWVMRNNVLFESIDQSSAKALSDATNAYMDEMTKFLPKRADTLNWKIKQQGNGKISKSGSGTSYTCERQN